MTLGWPWPFLWQGQICFLMLLYGKINIPLGKMLESHLMEETYNKWPEWQKIYVDIKVLTLRGCLLLPRGYIYMYKNMKKFVSNQRDFLKVATNGQSNKAFLLTSKFCPQGVDCPCPGTIYMYKIILTNVYQIRLQRDFFEICNKWAKWWSLSVDIKILSPRGCLPLPRGYIHE